MISVATWNIHKGFSQFNQRMVVHEMRARLRELSADIVFLQEVQGLHLKHAERHPEWPAMPQHEFLADKVWCDVAYGCNMVYDHGHHGNAILSRFPILHQHNQDVTHLQFERRGLLHCVIEVPQPATALTTLLHCVCVHLSLFTRSRRLQLDALAGYLETVAPVGTPLLIAGDFNDWRNHADELLAQRLGLSEIFSATVSARPSLSFPARWPLFRLDRIYQRGLTSLAAHLHAGPLWSALSDHAALSAQLNLQAAVP